MVSLEKLARFTRKPIRHKWAATKATIGELWKEMRLALMRMRAAQIESGIGNAGHVLYGLVRSMRPDVCVEIGSSRGKSACYIAMALKENRRGRLYAIDPHRPNDWAESPYGKDLDTAESFRTNISKLGLSEQVIMIRSTSEEAARDWQRPIDLIFIDGDHSYTGVKRDWELFAPHVRPFGIVVFHDTMWELPPWREYFRADMGVPRLVDELREQGFQVLTIDQDCGVSIVQPVVGGCPLRNTLPTNAVEHPRPAESAL